MHEAQYSLYASTHAPHLPRLARVDAASERLLQERYEVNELPALVLAWSSTKFTPYAGAHTAAAMAAFADAQLAPASVAVADAAALTQLLPSAPEDVLLVGFFNDLDDEAEELDDFREAAAALRRQRPDAVVRGAHATLTRALSDAYGPPMDARTAAAAALTLVEKKRPERRMILSGLGEEGGAPTSTLSSAASRP